MASIGLSDLTQNSVFQALAEFDELGRDAFLNRYKFGKARGYFVVHNGQRYDSKAIAGANTARFSPAFLKSGADTFVIAKTKYRTHAKCFIPTSGH